jgi:hypothetical protein
MIFFIISLVFLSAGLAYDIFARFMSLKTSVRTSYVLFWYLDESYAFCMSLGLTYILSTMMLSYRSIASYYSNIQQ